MQLVRTWLRTLLGKQRDRPQVGEGRMQILVSPPVVRNGPRQLIVGQRDILDLWEGTSRAPAQRQGPLEVVGVQVQLGQG